MKRPETIRLVGGAALAWPLAARSRASVCGAIGVLMPHPQDSRSDLLVARRRCRSWTYWAGPLAGTWRLIFVWGRRRQKYSLRPERVAPAAQARSVI